MRRWNGWGDEATDYPLPSGAKSFLEQHVGVAVPPRDATFDEVAAKVPASRLPPHVLVSTSPGDRLWHARGQSLPDWVALRSGNIPAFADGVAFPTTESEVRELLQYAKGCGAKVIAYGGGTSVVGHINAEPSEAPVLTISLARMNQLLRFDERTRLASFGAGVVGPHLEAQLKARGFTLGHFPQSWELSTLGGWVATRSSGQQSALYGRIEQMFAGGRVQTPLGELVLPPFPASAAGPDLRQMVLGSEGRLGIITEATVRISPRPEYEAFQTFFFRDWSTAHQAARELSQANIGFSMLRLSTPAETETMLALAGHEKLVGLMNWALAVRGASREKCMLLLGLTGTRQTAELALRRALDVIRAWGGIHIGRAIGDKWVKSRFHAPYLRNTLWDAGYAVDTLETATTWDKVPVMVEAIESAIRPQLESIGERVHVFTHLSHVYPTGSSIYTSYIFRLAPEPEETLRRWKLCKDAASAAIVTHGGTITHQHGIGIDHAPYLETEKGAVGLHAIRALIDHFDSSQMLNPGKLVR